MPYWVCGCFTFIKTVIYEIFHVQILCWKWRGCEKKKLQPYGNTDKLHTKILICYNPALNECCKAIHLCFEGNRTHSYQRLTQPSLCLLILFWKNHTLNNQFSKSVSFR